MHFKIIKNKEKLFSSAWKADLTAVQTISPPQTISAVHQYGYHCMAFVMNTMLHSREMIFRAGFFGKPFHEIARGGRQFGKGIITSEVFIF